MKVSKKFVTLRTSATLQTGLWLRFSGPCSIWRFVRFFFSLGLTMTIKQSISDSICPSVTSVSAQDASTQDASTGPSVSAVAPSPPHTAPHTGSLQFLRQKAQIQTHTSNNGNAYGSSTDTNRDKGINRDKTKRNLSTMSNAMTESHAQAVTAPSVDKTKRNLRTNAMTESLAQALTAPSVDKTKRNLSTTHFRIRSKFNMFLTAPSVKPGSACNMAWHAWRASGKGWWCGAEGLVILNLS
jgi:hypothetical protein